MSDEQQGKRRLHCAAGAGGRRGAVCGLAATVGPRAGDTGDDGGVADDAAEHRGKNLNMQRYGFQKIEEFFRNRRIRTGFEKIQDDVAV